MSISKYDDVIYSLDVIARIEELEAIRDDLETQEELHEWYESNEGKEFILLETLAEECEQYSSDWEYGESLIRYSYFEDYMDEMIDDCYELPKDMPYWMTVTYDYEALKQDYTEVEFDGITYYIRSC